MSTHDRSVERQLGELEVRVLTLEAEVRRIRDWRHSDLPAQLLAPVQRQVEDLHGAIADLKTALTSDGVGERRLLRMRDVYVFAAGVSLMAAVGKILGWF